MTVMEITNSDQKSEICNKILRSLPQWFGIESAIVDYVRDVQKMETWAAQIDNEIVGFVSLAKHSEQSAEVHVMGVLEKYHRSKIGQALIKKSEESLKQQGFKFFQVKTLSPSRPDVNYDKTRQFYLKMGFTPIEEFKTLWGEHNPCLLLVKNLLVDKTVYAVAGQMGSGKTSLARKLSKEKKALFFSTDQWIANLGVPIGSHENYAKYYTGIRERIYEVAKQALNLGVPVVFDFGVNQAKGRQGLLKFANEAGASVEIYHISVPTEVCRARVQERNKNKPHGGFTHLIFPMRISRLFQKITIHLQVTKV